MHCLQFFVLEIKRLFKGTFSYYTGFFNVYLIYVLIYKVAHIYYTNKYKCIQVYMLTLKKFIV